MVWSRLAIIAVILILLSPHGLTAQSGGPILPRDAIGASQMSQAQLDAVKAYAAHWVRQLAPGSKPHEVRAARDKLVEPLQGAGVAAPAGTFRFEYAAALINPLRSIVEGNDSYAAINALEVAGYLGTDSGLTLALDHADAAAGESRPEVRNWAAKAFKIAVRSGGLDAGSINRNVRRLERAGISETSWFALHSQLDALVAVDELATRVRDVDPAHNARINIIRSAIEKLGQDGGDADLVFAIAPAIFALQKDYVQLREARQREIGLNAAPVFGQFVQAASKHWDRFREDDSTQAKFSQAIDTIETFLRLVDNGRPGLPPTPSGLRSAWSAGDQKKFQTTVDQWAEILSRPPYANR